MTRSAPDIINSILVNLQMSLDVALAKRLKASKEPESIVCVIAHTGKIAALEEVIALIRVEAASLLGDKP